MTIEPLSGETVTLIEIFRDYYERKANEADLRRFLRAPVAIRAMKDLEERLNKLLSEN